MTTEPSALPRFSSILDKAGIGMEAEMTVFLDGKKVAPEEIWRNPAAFISQPVLKRSTKASQLPTGGAVYFDGGVIEVVTPVVELGPMSTTRVVRNLWDQIGFIRDELTGWQKRDGREVRLQGFSCHYNVSFELTREERGTARTIQKLALLLAHIIPIPLIVIGANRLSTGIGVRPRRNRLEVTLDFTPDPGLMLAAAALVVGVVRGVMEWPSYLLSALNDQKLPIPAGLSPAKHTTRKGWLLRAPNFPHDPFTGPVDSPDWPTTDGQVLSLREIALDVATRFRTSIERYADPFSSRILFSVLEGRTLSLLEMGDRPDSYDDVGTASRWGNVIPELDNYESEIRHALAGPKEEDITRAGGEARYRRGSDVAETLAAPWVPEGERRGSIKTTEDEQRRHGRRQRAAAVTAPVPELARSDYEKVFIQLGSGQLLHLDDDVLTPLAVKGWYHALFRSEKTGEERLISIDQLLTATHRWA